MCASSASSEAKRAATSRLEPRARRVWGSSRRQAYELAEKADALWKSGEPQSSIEVSMGEAAPQGSRWIADTLKLPDAVALDASAHRLELLELMGVDCVALGLDAATSANAENSLERMLCHQLAAAHKTALDIIAKAVFELDALSKARYLTLAVRFMDTFQRGLLTLQRIRSGGEQTIVVKQVTVADGGQAVVGSVRTSGKDSK
jgi:hypothetical protein